MLVCETRIGFICVREVLATDEEPLAGLQTPFVEQVAKTGYVCTAPELQQRGFWENNAVW
jgi:hypothetical protein